MTFDFSVIWRNLDFLLLQGFLGFVNFVGGTLRLAIPSIVLGFILGIIRGYYKILPPPSGYLAVIYSPGHWPIKPGVRIPIEFA